MSNRIMVGKIRCPKLGAYIDIYKVVSSNKYVASIYGQLPLPFDEQDSDVIEDTDLFGLVNKIFNRFNYEFEYLINNEWLPL